MILRIFWIVRKCVPNWTSSLKMKLFPVFLSHLICLSLTIVLISPNFSHVSAEFTAKKDNFFAENVLSHLYKLGDEMYPESPENKKLLRQILDTTSESFDYNGYKWLLEEMTNRKSSKRFTQALDHPRFNKPHCDRGSWVDPISGLDSFEKFPGGPYRGSGFSLTTWMGNMYKNVHTPESANEPSAANMALQIFNMVKGVIQTIIAIIVDTVPPIVIGNPLPCLPMLTGLNCIGSVLYPIAATDFVIADVIDSSMNGIISSFPAKYAAKVGRTDDFRYKTCATFYLGMYCASIFPMCATGAAQVAQTFPICFPQCLAVLVACPGFWIDDIGAACGSNVSIPPFCSFSAFINYPRIPPQYTSYDASKLYPEMCPKYDPNQDLPLDLYSKKDVFHSSIADASKEKAEKLPLYEKLIRSLEFHYAPRPKPCDCEMMKAKCRLHIPYPIHIKASEQVSETHYEKPELTSEDEKRCCEECKPIWEAIYSVK